MQVTVIGAGAMGCVFGAALARAGASVVLCDIRAEHVEGINRDGLRLEGVQPDRVMLRATTTPGDLPPTDVALILVDSNATPAAAAIARGCLTAGGYAITLQNGIGNIEALAAALGPASVAAGSTYNSAAGLGPGRVLHSNRGPTAIGEIDGAASARMRALADTFAKGGLPVEVSDNIVGHVWMKFALNCAINPVSAVTGLRPGEIARTPPAARLLEAMLDEILTVVAAKNVRLPEADPRQAILDHCRERYNRPSMLQHLDAGRATEIDALNGALVRAAAKLNLPAPVNEAIVLAVKGIEARQRLRTVSPVVDEQALESAARAEAVREA